MRARLFAIAILVILIVIPISLYLYFTTQKIAKLTIYAGTGVDFSVHLLGSFGLDGLPLANRVLTYSQSCISTCVFSPILPAKYTLTLTSSGKTTIVDTININTAEQIKKVYTLNDDISFVFDGKIPNDPILEAKIIDNAKNSNIGKFGIIGTDIQNHLWVEHKMENYSQIGLLSMERFISIKNINIPIVGIRLDSSHSVIIIDVSGSRTIFLPIDLSDELEVELPSMDIISVISGSPWKILTNSGSFEIRGGSLVEDIRFTQSIDMSSQVRIGYIDKNDTKKLALSNFPLHTSILIRLDRTTGKSTVLRTGIDIKTLFFYNKKPAYIDSLGNIFIFKEI